MRNLTIASSSSQTFPLKNITSAVYDVEADCMYVISEREAGVDIDIEIFKIHGGSSEEVPILLSSFSVPSFSAGDRIQIVSLHLLTETRSLALLTLGGDIGLIPIDDDGLGPYDTIGTIDNGIKAACWGPDESTVVIITGDDKLLLMTSSFDVLSEGPLHSSDKGEAQPVNVGWGSKQTQFHGSLGKVAAQVPQTPLDAIGSSPDDDGIPRISWRGDCAFFVVCSLEKGDARPRRVLRVYDRQAILQNTSEPVAGLEHGLSWCPSGNLIASTQRFGFEGGGAGREGRHDVVFFERNGLRHGEFGLREVGKARVEDSTRWWGYKVRELLWNSGSNIIAVWIERDECDIVQLWTTGNYHWYLKQEILPPSGGDTPVRFVSMRWHPEDPLRILLLTPTTVLERTLGWETFYSREEPPNDAGIVAVVDGASLLLTPFRTQNVPPPMSSCRLAVGLDAAADEIMRNRTPVHLAFSSHGDHLAVLSTDGRILLWNLRTRIEFSRSKALDPLKICEFCFTSLLEGWDRLTIRQICLWKGSSAPDTFTIACLASDSDTDVIAVLNINGKEVQAFESIKLAGKNGRLANSSRSIFWQSREGAITEVISPLTQLTRFPEFCFETDCILNDVSTLFVGKTETNRLYCTTQRKEPLTLSNNCTSFMVAGGFVIFTTTLHEACFAPISAVRELLSSASSSTEVPQWERRRVERGSRIVTAVPSTMSLVLQMPRGNLETINPRPMVLRVVKQDLESKNYRKAFLACRKHRIDFAIFVEHDPEAFLRSISLFIEQIDDVDYLNLFLTNLGQSALDSDSVAKYCDAIREELEKRDLTRYVNSILTAYVMKRPADYEASLSLLLRLRAIDQELVEEAVKYVIFLVDADRLFDTALGMYDFSLVLLIAQHSQRDPREYLPFLRELRALPKYYQRFKIDDHLKRYPNALMNLSLAGQQYFEEAIAYVEKHKLYADALSLWRDSAENHKRVLDVYGEYLFDRREFRQAALVFIGAQLPRKALVAFERALLWRDLFDFAIRENLDEDEMQVMAYRVADELLSKKKYQDAAQVFLDHANNVRQCIIALSQGNLFSEARRVITLRREPSLLEEIIYPAVLDTRSQVAEDLEEMRTQLEKQVERLSELRIRKEEEPDAFYGLDDDPTLHNVDVMTDVSMPGTAFTRYTAAPSTSSRTSKRTSRSKRKMERKVGSGKKGTIDEEEYLLKSIGKLVTRFDSIQADIAELLLHLVQFTAEHREEARSLQQEIHHFRVELQKALDEVWPADRGTPEDSQINGAADATNWSERMEEKKRERKRTVEHIVKPEITTTEESWKVQVFDV